MVTALGARAVGTGEAVMSRTLVARAATVLALIAALLSTPMSPAAGAAEDAIVGLQEETFTIGPLALAPEGQPGDPPVGSR